MDHVDVEMVYYTLQHLSHCYYLLLDASQHTFNTRFIPFDDFDELLDRCESLYKQLSAVNRGPYEVEFQSFQMDLHVLIKDLYRQALHARKQLQSRMAGFARLERFLLMELNAFLALPEDCQQYVRSYLTPLQEKWVPDHGSREDWIAYEACYVFSKNYGWEILEQWDPFVDRVVAFYQLFQ